MERSFLFETRACTVETILHTMSPDSPVEFAEPSKVDPVGVAIVGVGALGLAAIDAMAAYEPAGLKLLRIDTDEARLATCRARTKLLLGPRTTRGGSTRGVVDLGREAAVESIPAFDRLLDRIDMIIFLAGLGGGTGAGATSVLAKRARDLGVGITIACISELPEGADAPSTVAAERALEAIGARADSTIVVPRLVPPEVADFTRYAGVDPSARAMCWVASEFPGMLTHPGLLGIDCQDVRRVTQGHRRGRMTFSRASGERRAEQVVANLLESPLLGDLRIRDCRTFLVAVEGSVDLKLSEIDVVASALRQQANDEALLVVGAHVERERDASLVTTVFAFR